VNVLEDKATFFKVVVLPINRIFHFHCQRVGGGILDDPENLRVVKMDTRNVHAISLMRNGQESNLDR
jgi:hypothetical protein